MRRGIQQQQQEQNNRINVIIVKNIKIFRTKKNTTRKELAKKFNYSISQIGNFERGIQRIRACELFKLAKFFDVSINNFFENNEK